MTQTEIQQAISPVVCTADVHSGISHLGYSLPAQLRCFVKKLFIQNNEAPIWTITLKENQALQCLPSQIASWASLSCQRGLFL